MLSESVQSIRLEASLELETSPIYIFKELFNVREGFFLYARIHVPHVYVWCPRRSEKG